MEIVIFILGMTYLAMRIVSHEKNYEGMGELQTKWVKFLLKNPHLQTKAVLGMSTKDSTKYCCLGVVELIVCKSKQLIPFWEKNDNFFLSSYNLASANSIHVLDLNSFQTMGLYSENGEPLDNMGYKINDSYYASLASANDSDVSWTDIANYIIANPEKVFKYKA